MIQTLKKDGLNDEYFCKVYDEDWKYIGQTKIYSSKNEALREAYDDI